MSENHCCVLSPKDRVKWDLESHGQEECRFTKLKFDLIEYNGKYYCPLHLPNESPNKLDVDTEGLLIACIKLDVFNFRFIKLNRFNLENINTSKPLLINCSIINELIIEDCDFQSILIEKTEFFEQTKIKCQVGFITLENVKSFCKDFILELSTNEININECTFFSKDIPEKNDPFINPKLQSIENQKVSISGNQINRLNIIHSIFHVHLEIDTNNIANTTFSSDNKFDRVPSIITHTPEKFDGAYSMSLLEWGSIKRGLERIYCSNKKYYQAQLSGECDRLKNLYRIASIKLLYENESNYYELMHRCLENDPKTPWLKRSFSKLYRIFGGYGVAIFHPLVSIIGLIVVAYCLFYLQTNSFSSAVDYLIYPFKLFRIKVPSSLCVKLTFIIYSLCLYTLTTFLIISLRWTFKKR